MAHDKINWSDSYLLGIAEIDLQHKKLLEIANNLYDITVSVNADYQEKMADVIEELINYTIYHFSEEEKFMASYNYPSVATHKVAHDSFIRSVTLQAKKFDNNNKKDALDLYDFMVNWVVNHIVRTDPLWAKFVKKVIETKDV